MASAVSDGIVKFHPRVHNSRVSFFGKTTQYYLQQIKVLSSSKNLPVLYVLWLM